MNRIILRFLNPPLFILLGTFAIAIQTSLFAPWPLSPFKPDPVLWLVIWCALRRPFIEGGILVLLLGNILEIHSSAPRGLPIALYMAVFLAVAGANRLLVIPNFKSYATVTTIAHALGHLFGIALLGFLGAFTGSGTGWGWKTALFLVLPRSAIEGALSIWIYPWLEKFDTATYKIARSELDIEGLEDVGLT